MLAARAAALFLPASFFCFEGFAALLSAFFVVAAAGIEPGKSDVKPSIRPAGGHKDVGDKREVHTSEEELGVTTPAEDGAEK